MGGMSGEMVNVDGYFSPERLSDPASQTALSFISHSCLANARQTMPVRNKNVRLKTAISY